MAAEEESAGWILAFKQYNNEGMSACDLDDPDANLFRVHWKGSRYSSSSIDCETKYKSEWIVIAVNDAYRAGRKQAFRELRNLIGVKS